jgi:translation initiation factor 2 subunit 3
MTTMLSGAAVMDGAVLVIAANESVPQPQTREHLVALEIIGVKNVVIAQNKIDVVPREQVLKNYEQIKEFVEGTIAENSPVIPTSAQHGVNLDILMEAFEKFLPTPDRDLKKPPRMFVVRSFDVNKPGLPVEKIVGGVLGGTVLQGEFEVGDEIEMSPGIRVKDEYEGLFTEIVSLQAGGKFVEKVKCGGLVGVGTKLDPSLTKADGLVGNVVGRPGTLPLPLNSITIEATLFDRAIGTRELVKVEKIAVKESLVLNLGTTVTAGVVTSVKDDLVSVSLRRPVCAEEGMQVAISRRISGRWRLIGYGKVRL